MNENIFENQSTVVADDLQNGLHAVLYKRIGNVTITDTRIRDAFALFVKEVECNSTISVAELLYSAEALVRNGTPDTNAGNLIYCYEGKAANAKLIKNSVSGIYSLFTLPNGITLDIDAMGGSISSAEIKQFLVASPKKCERLVKKAESEGLKPVRVGQMLSTNKIILTRSGEIFESVNKTVIDNTASAVSIKVGSEHFSSFLSGYLAVCSLSLCNCISVNNIIRFGLGGDIESVFARALGFFAASYQLKSSQMRSVFIAENSATVAVSRPNVEDGDYFYLLKLRNAENGLPDRAHLNQLNYYLLEKKREGIIKDVLPVKENIEGLINRLSTETVVYESLASVPENCFGVIVSVRRGESGNGIKLGYFKNI